MKKLLFLVSVLIVAASCSTIKVTSDFDRNAGFASYKTYAFTPEALNLPLDDINKSRVLSAIETELAAKGFTKTQSDPDVLIDVVIKAEQKTTATASNTGGYYGRAYRYGYGGGFTTTTINYETYTDGTMFIDMIDADKQQLVWQGRGTKTLDPDASTQKREDNINYAVKQIFMKYPPQI
ncbi:MAG: DUF4136 domain-containing protein [Bacteroidales bacterium]|nr:DUF4136 domain-containing protein [Bacteroidales bacterium]